jgi:hypothetical protein
VCIFIPASQRCLDELEVEGATDPEWAKSYFFKEKIKRHKKSYFAGLDNGREKERGEVENITVNIWIGFRDYNYGVQIINQMQGYFKVL